MPKVQPLGDRGLLAGFATEREAAAWAAAVRAQLGPAVVDVVAAYRTVAVFPDPERVDWSALTERLRTLEPPDAEVASGRCIDLPVLYDGPDLPDVARRLGRSETDVVAEHSTHEYTVFAVGFLPGFPYAGYLPPGLSGLPRRSRPRTRVPAGSVAIAGRQTGVYPTESPGGWHLLGRTPLHIADLASGHFPIQAGDRLRFRPITLQEFETRLGELLS